MIFFIQITISEPNYGVGLKCFLRQRIFFFFFLAPQVSEVFLASTEGDFFFQKNFHAPPPPDIKWCAPKVALK